MKISYTRPDGGLSIVIAAPKAVLERVLGPLTDEMYRDHVHDRAVPKDARDILELPDDWTPRLDRAFRDAWVAKDGEIGVDMPKARDIHRARLRVARAPLLAALDIETMRATEKSDIGALAEVLTKKQDLRDAPAHAAIDRAKTPDELKKLTIEVLSANSVN